ncbi:ABC transporter ATP-binding protein [Candidatus Kaiserbacteria bacterium]|nr:ABC transporter ATP-binding protein [Candidatus Kaiserbacteria bacterium]NCT01957.1 ABC transporter ATP-binding protein [Candidatus Parcubacteria bacterium]
MDIIQAKKITRSFGREPLITHVLRGVDVHVAEGEFLTIMGKSGAGKSTLMYQLSVLDTPSSGELVVDGVDVMQLNEKERTSFRLHTLGYVFQDYALVPDLSARENVMMPLLMRGDPWATAKRKAAKSLDEVGLAGKYENLPTELSGGEQQRVAIARAIAVAPKIIFADEPTANLDTVSSKQIIDLLTCLNETSGQTIVMVTHEREYALGANRILHMEDGMIIREEKLR